MHRYAAVAGLGRRLVIPVRPLTPKLSALWVGLVTPVPDAISLALRRIRDADVETRWSTATWTAAPSEPLPTDPAWSGGTVYTDHRERDVDAPAAALWRVIEAIGGEHGWYSFPLAWSVRGWLDRLVGGVGLHHLHLGEALDFWRVEEIIPATCCGSAPRYAYPDRPGWRCAPPRPHRHTAATRSVPFLPRGLAGHAYWAAVWLFHAVVFGGMARNIARTAIKNSAASRPRLPPAS
jgi:uncharacterized protein DUF2867